MTVHIPRELEPSLLQHAQQRQVSPHELVIEALQWYLQIGPASIDELAAWQTVRDEALRLVEESPSCVQRRARLR